MPRSASPARTDGTLAVLGGMGQLAGAASVTRLTQLTRAATDQDHIPVLLRNDPRIPDRSAARLRLDEVERCCGVAIEAAKANPAQRRVRPTADGIRILAKRGAPAVCSCAPSFRWP